MLWEWPITRDQWATFATSIERGGESMSNMHRVLSCTETTVPGIHVIVHRVGTTSFLLRRCSRNCSPNSALIYPIFTPQGYLPEDCFRTKLDRVCPIFLHR